MQLNTITKQKLPFFVALGLMAVLTSCGSFQYAGYDNDGIYSTDKYEDENVEQEVVTTSTDDSNYYKNYFAENSAEVDAIQEENEIFTDVDSYEGNYTEQDSTEQRPAYGGWGQNNSTVSINIINNGWYGWNDPWLYSGYYSNGWGRPWGWNNWGYNYGWGWNNPWAYGSYYGYGWNPGWAYYGGHGGYYNYGWNNGYYRNTNRYAYNSGRRGSLGYNTSLNRRNRSNAAISRGNYSTRRLSNAASPTRNTRVRSTNTSLNNTIRNTRSTRPTRTIRNSSSTRSNPSTRVTRPSRSTRSSGSVRSTRSTRSSSSSSVRSSRSSSSSSSRRSRG